MFREVFVRETQKTQNLVIDFYSRSKTANFEPLLMVPIHFNIRKDMYECLNINLTGLLYRLFKIIYLNNLFINVLLSTKVLYNSCTSVIISIHVYFVSTFPQHNCQINFDKKATFYFESVTKK
jgi:hypothetical protein